MRTHANIFAPELSKFSMLDENIRWCGDQVKPNVTHQTFWETDGFERNLSDNWTELE